MVSPEASASVRVSMNHVVAHVNGGTRVSLMASSEESPFYVGCARLFPCLGTVRLVAVVHDL